MIHSDSALGAFRTGASHIITLQRCLKQDYNDYYHSMELFKIINQYGNYLFGVLNDT